MTGTPAAKRPLTTKDKQEIGESIADGLLEVVGGNPGLFLDRPAFIAGDGPSSPLPNAVRAISQLNCRVWASNDKTNYSTRVNLGNAELCGPYLDSIGENPDDGDITPPFLGGQCSTNYLTYGQLDGNDQTIGGLTPLNLSGPLRFAGRREVATPGEPFLDSRRTFFDFETATGLRSVGVAWRSSFPFPRSFRIERTDGLADDCGNQPATDIRPPATVTPGTPFSPTITINLPGLGPVEVNVDLDPDGNPIVCIPELETCVTVEVGGDGGGGGGGDPVAPTTPGSPGDGGDTGSGGEADGEAPPDKELSGVLVQVLSAPGSPNTFQNVSATVYRGVGYVAMGYPGMLGIDATAAVFESPQFFHAQQRGLTAWRVRANVGFSLRATPYYREVTGT